MTRLRELLPLLLMLAPLPSVFLGGCGPGSGGSGGTLVALNLDVQGRTDVARNEPVTVQFSSNLDPTSVGVSGFQIQNPAGDIVPGRIVVEGSLIRFYPTFFNGIDGQGVDQSVNQYNPPNDPPVNALGFASGTRFSVRVLGSSPSSPTTTSGRPVVETFFGSFRTAGDFLGEDVSILPTLASAPEFNQTPTNADCQPDPIFGEPTLACPPGSPDLVPVPSFDPSQLEVVLTFTEPMNPASFNPFSTLVLQNVTNLEPRTIFGEIEPSEDLLRFTFRPLATLGDDPFSSDPFQFELLLSPEIQDLAGNGLGGNPEVDGNRGRLEDPIVLRFSTIDKPGEPSFDFLLEEFDSQINRLGQEVSFGTDPGVWLGSGILEGSPVRFREADLTPMNPTQFRVIEPLTPTGNRIQLLLDKLVLNPSGFGVPESIIGLSWGPQSNFVDGSNYPEITIALGHTQADIDTGGLDLTFAQNFAGFADNPTVVYNGSYLLSPSLNQTLVPWPEFRTDFEYDGRSNIAIDIDVQPGGTATQLFRHELNFCDPSARVYGPAGASVGRSENVCGAGDDALYAQRIQIARKRSFASSRFLDTGFDSPDYGLVVIIAQDDRPGTSFTVTFRGRPAVGFPPRPDESQTVGPVDDINLLDGLRFISFSVELVGEPFTGVTPSVDSIAISFESD